MLPMLNPTSLKIESILTQPLAIFDRRRYLVLPNAYYGMGFSYEMDLLIITWTGRIGYEVEIKISLADLKRDLSKSKFEASKYTGKNRLSGRVAGMWYAMPIQVWEKGAEYVPADAGVIVIGERELSARGKTWSAPHASVIRKPARKKQLYKWKDQELAKMTHLLSMRLMDHRERKAHEN